jgi:Holliday junction resolvase RusA-like endonuclease
MIVTLPFPHPGLSPNRSHGKHWSATSALRKTARQEAFILTKSLRPSVVGDGSVSLKITFVQPDKRQRDRDNLLSALKPSLDGIADALGINDSRFDPVTICRAFGPKPGCVVVEIGI